MVKIVSTLNQRKHGVPDRIISQKDLPASSRKLRRFHKALERKKEKENGRTSQTD
jgi:hypothetical protein